MFFNSMFLSIDVNQENEDDTENFGLSNTG